MITGRSRGEPRKGKTARRAEKGGERSGMLYRAWPWAVCGKGVGNSLICSDVTDTSVCLCRVQEAAGSDGKPRDTFEHIKTRGRMYEKGLFPATCRYAVLYPIS